MGRKTHVREHPRRTRSGDVTEVTDHDRNLKDGGKPKPLDPKRKKPDEEKEIKRLEKAIESLDLPPNMDLEIAVFDLTRTNNRIILELLIDRGPLVSGEVKYLNIHYETVPSNVPGVFSFNSVDEAIAFLNANQGKFNVNPKRVQEVANRIHEQAIKDAFYGFSDDDTVDPSKGKTDLDIPHWVGGFAEDYYRFGIGPSTPYLPYADIPTPENGFLVHALSHDGEQGVDMDEELHYVGTDLNDLEKEMAKQQFVMSNGYAHVRYSIAMGVYVDGPKAVEEVKNMMEEDGMTKDEAIQDFISALEGNAVDVADHTRDNLEEYLSEHVKAK